MMRLKLKEVITAINGTLLAQGQDTFIEGVSTDSRSVKTGDIFFALQGDKFDGHRFVSDVINRGCNTIVINDANAADKSKDVNYILVSDTLTAYQDLAKYYKMQISPITIGITGSVGKTSLKDMVKTICNDYFNTVASIENENNHIGVPKTIFRMEKNTEVLILEMGMSAPGEIHRLVDIGRPNIGAITNVGFSHIENFQDQDGIFSAKMEITDYFGEHETLVINGDDPYFSNMKANREYKILSAGIGEDSDYIAKEAGYLDDTHITFLIDYDKGVERLTLPIAGLYNNTTAAMAVAIMSKLEIGVSSCAHSLMKLQITPHRLQLIGHGGLKIIDDTYNASPISMKSALEYLMAIKSNRKIAVLADMKELGSMSYELHMDIGTFVATTNIDYLFTVGALGEKIGEAALKRMGSDKVFSYEDKVACVKHLKEILRDGDGILVKGSHSMGMSEVVDSLSHGD
jgi:UDP-N-acetylmuramoyl-tripeptide--D-alanyl-D-alanine ligase